MSGRVVYYICTRMLRGTSAQSYNELFCHRVVREQRDPVFEILLKGFTNDKQTLHTIVYPSSTSPTDLNWEKSQLQLADPYDYIRIVPFEIPTRKME